MTIARLTKTLWRGLPSVALLCSLALPRTAAAQTEKRPDAGLMLRTVSASLGDAAVQLPPLALGGIVPQDVLSADLIGTAGLDLAWNRVTRRSGYYVSFLTEGSARRKYSAMNTLSANLTTQADRKVGRHWSVSATGNGFVGNSDQLSWQPTQSQEVTTTARSVEDMAAALALARSVRPADRPDIGQAALFQPISQLLVVDSNGDRLVGGSLALGLTYSRSARLSAFANASSSLTRRMPSTASLSERAAVPDVRATVATAGISYLPTARSELGVSVSAASLSGAFNDRTTSASVSYGWHGRRWLTESSVGVSMRPLPGEVGVKPSLTYFVAFGYKSRTQAFMGSHSRVAHDPHGYSGGNAETGFGGSLSTVTASWYWTPRLSKWTVQSHLGFWRGPGNFLFIHTWNETFMVDRELAGRFRLGGEFLFDRHGSRAFEGFHLTREVFRVKLVWSPQKRLL